MQSVALMPLDSHKIVFFATQLYPLAMGRSSGFGGAETELWNVARGLADDSDYDVRVLTFSNETDQPSRFGNLLLTPLSPGDEITYGDSWLKRRRVMIAQFFYLLRQLTRQRGDIYFSKLASREASTVWLASRLARGRFVFRIEHDWEVNPDQLRDIIFKGHAMAARIFIGCLKRADLVIAQTQKQKDALEKNFGIHSVLIPNGHKIPPDDSIEHDPDRRPIVLWVGRAHPMKRPMLFFDLAKRHPAIEFVMVMSPSREYPELTDSCRARAGETPNVTFVPGASPDDLAQYYGRARALALTSEAEGFSNVIIEAMKYGAPVLCLDHNPNGLLADYSGDDQPRPHAGYCTGDSLDACSRLVELLFTAPEFWRQCNQMAHELAAENFGLDRVLDMYKQEFRRLYQ